MAYLMPVLQNRFYQFGVFLHIIGRNKPGRLQVEFVQNLQYPQRAFFRSVLTDRRPLDVGIAIRQRPCFIDPNRFTVQVKTKSKCTLCPIFPFHDVFSVPFCHILYQHTLAAVWRYNLSGDIARCLRH